MKRRSWVLIPFLIPLLALNVGLVLAGKLVTEALIPSLVTFVLVLLAYWFLALRGEPVQKDERTIRLTRAAGMYSWLFTMYIVVLLTGTHTLGLIQLSGLQYLGIVLMVMTFSFLVLQIILNRMPDSE